MSVRPNIRVVLATALAASLYGGGLAAVWASDSSTTCGFSDPSGDAAVGDGSSNGDLDLTHVSFSTADDGSVLLTAKVKQLGGSGPTGYPGDEFEFDFTMNDKSIVLGAVRTAGSDPTAYALVDGDDATSSAASLTPTFDADASTASLSISMDDLSTLADTDASAATASDLGAMSYARDKTGSSLSADDASGGAAVWTVGGSCNGSTGDSGSGGANPSSDPSADPSSNPAPGLLDQPDPACSLFTDVADDADPKPFGQSSGTGKDADLDLRAVTIKSMPDSIVGFVKINDLADKPASGLWAAHRFILGFTFNSLPITYRADAAGPGLGSLSGTVNPDLTATVAFDTTRNQVVFTISRAGLLKATRSEPADGKKLSAVTAASQVLYVGHNSYPTAAPVAQPAPLPVDPPVDVDSAAGATIATQSYTVGDNTCFYPPDAPKSSKSAKPVSKAAKITVTAPTKVQYGDPISVALTLKTSAGKTLPDTDLTVQFGKGEAVTATTDEAGKAALKVPTVDAAGKRKLLVSFAGDEDGNEAAKVTKTITVSAEVTKLTGKASGTGKTHTYTATLTDDDKPAAGVAGQTLTFAYSGKKVNVKTNAKGQAAIKVPAGTSVAVSYAGKTGYYVASKTSGKA
jgi:hypothetical protein